MVNLKKMLFWIEKGQNVMFRGKHGVGKTSMILKAFESAGLNYRYFSASTMDPFIDFCGVPIKVEEDGNTRIRMILPETIVPDEIEAIFLDEYNRCLTGDTKIQLADGSFSKIEDLENKEYFYTYSYDVEKNKVVIGKGHSARITEKNALIYAVTLDNGSVIKCTGNHPFLLSSGKYKRADELQENESLMCLFKKYNEKGYELVSATKQLKWTPTYHLSDLYNIENNIYQESDGVDQRHHKDFNKFNNSPENIERLTRLEHLKIHANNKESYSNGGRMAHKKHINLAKQTILTKESKEKALQNSIHTRKTSKIYKKIRSDISKKMYSSEMRKHRSKITKQQWEKGQFKNINRALSLKKTHIKKTINFLEKKGFSPRTITLDKYENIRDFMKKQKPGKGSGILTQKKIKEYFNTFENFVLHWESIKSENTEVMNHKVIYVKEIGHEDVWDITVDKYHNFALESGVFVHNSHKKIRNSTMELIQFKSINGRVFPNLKVVWVAVNPDDDDGEKYDVERMDPAQADRFHVHVDIPYKPDRAYFNSKYDRQTSDAAIEWWSNLGDEEKNMVSPRRLDYALEMYGHNGDIADILPKECNPTQLKQFLGRGSLIARLREIMSVNDVDEAGKILRDPFYGDAAIDQIIKKEFINFYLPLLSEEIVSKAFCSPKWRPNLTKVLTKRLVDDGENEEVIKNILSASTLNSLQKKSLKKRLEKSGWAFTNIDNNLSIINSALRDCDREANSSAARQRAYLAIERILNNKKVDFKKAIKQEDLLKMYSILIDIKARSQKDTVNRQMPKAYDYLNIIIKEMVERRIDLWQVELGVVEGSPGWKSRCDRYTARWGSSPQDDYMKIYNEALPF